MEKRVRIIVHCLVRNESRWIWYSIKSVLDYVDEIMVWDSGSDDETVEIIKSIPDSKIKFKSIDKVDINSFTEARQKMLNETPAAYTWLMILDGDEIWTKNSIKTASKFIRENPNYESVFVRTNNLVGDIYHRLQETAGNYKILNIKGHLNLRFINLKLIPGLHLEKPHGQQGYFDEEGKLIQNRNPQKIKFLNIAYHHATHLQRSSTHSLDIQVPKRRNKLKYEIGEVIPRTEIPEIFFKSHPKIVPDVIGPANLWFWVRSLIETFPRRIKRAILRPHDGY